MTARVALVGAGWWATTHHLPAILDHPDAEVVAVCDPVSERAEATAAAAGAHSYASLEAALATERLDAVVVATPNAHHREPVMTALAAGLHVLVEKPLATTSADAFEMVVEAERRGVHLSVGHTHQFDAPALHAQRAVQEGIGELVQVTAEFSSGAVRLFAAAAADEWDGAEHPQSYSASNGGGQATTQLVHALGMVCWATGEEIATVAAFTNTRGLEVDVDDAAAFAMRGGATGVAIGSGATPSEVRHHQTVRYLGSQGAVHHDLLRSRVTWQRADGSFVRYEPDQHEGAYRPREPARAFVELILGRGDDLGPARPAAAAAAAVEAVLESARHRRFTDVAQLPPPPL